MWRKVIKRLGPQLIVAQSSSLEWLPVLAQIDFAICNIMETFDKLSQRNIFRPYFSESLTHSGHWPTLDGVNGGTLPTETWVICFNVRHGGCVATAP